MRRLLTGILAALILLTLAACGSEKTDAGNDGKEEDSATVNGVVNCMGDFLVLLTDDGTYQVFDFGEDVDQGRLEEGDSVTVTYTGELGSEDPVPVAVSVEKTDAVYGTLSITQRPANCGPLLFNRAERPGQSGPAQQRCLAADRLWREPRDCWRAHCGGRGAAPPAGRERRASPG